MRVADLKKELDGLREEMAVYNSHLEKHMSRTSLVEASLQAQREHFEYVHAYLEKRLDAHEAKFNGLSMRLLQYVSIAGGLVGLLKLLFDLR